MVKNIFISSVCAFLFAGNLFANVDNAMHSSDQGEHAPGIVARVEHHKTDENEHADIKQKLSHLVQDLEKECEKLDRKTKQKFAEITGKIKSLIDEMHHGKSHHTKENQR